MLNSLRESAGSWVVKGFLLILVASFALWGIEDIFRVSADDAVATVGDAEISQQAFLTEFNNEMRQMQASFGPSFDRDQARAIGLPQNALQRLTERALYDQEVARLGLTLSDDDIAAAIRANPAFRSELGNFDRFRFEQVINQAGFTEQGYVAALRTDIARNQLLGTVTSGVASPPPMVDAIFRYQQETRVFDVVAVSHASQRNVEVPDEVALREFYDANADLFMAPEFRALTFVVLRPEDLTDEILISEEELQSTYEDRRTAFVREEQREVDQIVVADEQTALAITTRLRGGADFLTVAREVANQDEATVRLGLLTSGDLLEEVAGTVFALQVDAVSDPVQSPLGWHVFRVREIVAGEVKQLDDVREQLLAELKLEEASDALFDLANKVDDMLAGGASLEEVSEALDLRHGRIASVDAAGRGPAGQPVNDLPAAREFLATAFATEPGEEQILHEADDGSYFLVRVDTVTAPALRPLDAVRSEVEAGVTAQRRAEAAEAKAQILADKARAGASMADLAREAESSLVKTEGLVRGRAAVAANLSADLVTTLFAMTPGEIASGAALDGEAQMVVRVADVQAADATRDSAALERLTELLNQSVTGDLISQYRDALGQRYPVSVNDRVIDAIFDDRGYMGQAG